MKLQPYNIKDIPTLGVLVLTDIHLGGANEHKEGAEIVRLILLGTVLVYYKGKEYDIRKRQVKLTGDIIEASNSLDPVKAVELILRLKEIMGDDYIPGNHDYPWNVFRGFESLIVKKVTQVAGPNGVVKQFELRHFHETWKAKKAIKYCTKPNGCSKFKYKYWVPMVESIRGVWKFKPKKKHIRRLLEYVNPESDFIIGGHVHSEKNITVKAIGKDKEQVFLFLSQGVHEI